MDRLGKVPIKSRLGKRVDEPLPPPTKGIAATPTPNPTKEIAATRSPTPTEEILATPSQKPSKKAPPPPPESDSDDEFLEDDYANMTEDGEELDLGIL